MVMTRTRGIQPLGTVVLTVLSASLLSFSKIYLQESTQNRPALTEPPDTVYLLNELSEHSTNLEVFGDI